MKSKLLSKLASLSAAAMLLATASGCKDDTFAPYEQELSEDVNVSFTIANEATSVSARGGEDGSKIELTDHISGGSKVDMLIYAVYDGEGNLLEGYSNGTDAELAALGYDHGDGQTIKKVQSFPYEVNITLKRGQEYTVAFWAQSSKTKAYDTSDLRKIRVKYGEFNQNPNQEETDDSADVASALDEGDTDGGASGDGENLKTATPNNDEYRDAFCRKVTFTAGDAGKLQQDVLLYRPFAQINVGTTGYDYEIVTRGSKKKYTYSKIRLNRVARYLDLYENRTYLSTTADDDDKKYEGERETESFYVADFGYAPIPAYYKFYDENRDYSNVPNYPSFTRYDWEYDSAFDLLPEDSNTGYNIEGKIGYQDEEFLRVELGLTRDEEKDPKEEDGYIGYANYNNYNSDDVQTETFKYLSMCYVLTASDDDKASVLNNVKVWLATDENGTDEVEILNINQVPVQRNWRTNIIGNLLTETPNFQVVLDKDFAGDYNGVKGDGTDIQWSGPIAKGVYYNAEEDVIEISDVDGLLWFQQMVNGILYVRDRTDKLSDPTKIDEQKNKYPYYAIDDYNDNPATVYLEQTYIDPSNLKEDILRRISYATHIADNKKTNGEYISNSDIIPNTDILWPKNNNFNFYGAKVRLMADIDLAGIEWIPIGFDFCIHDNTISATSRIGWKDVNRVHGLRRLFCGTFDGNGHTIRNLKTKRFGARVHDDAIQKYNGAQSFYDNVQWMPAGFFGMIGEGATVKNLTLENIDIYGYHTAGAIAGIAFSSTEANYVAEPIKVENCNVNGGSIQLSPMYRGDVDRTPGNNKTAIDVSRTFARGIYVGGIIGHMIVNKDDNESHITGCSVRNATLRAYRRIGGILGSMSNSENGVDNWPNDNWNIDVSKNSVSNTTIIADKFVPYDRLYCDWDATNKIWKNGYGWVTGQLALGDYIVGGILPDDNTVYNSQNSYSGVVFTELATGMKDGSTKRESEIGNISLPLMPMLSSWFTDEIKFNHNYYGAAAAKTRLNVKAYTPWLNIDKEMANYKIEVPMALPNDLSIRYVDDAPNVGMYVESVKIDGSGAVGGRSVITAENVSGEGACTMFITARDRVQFETFVGKYLSSNKDDISKQFTQPTSIEKLTIKGAPYAYAGILIAPNENMSEVVLNDVAIYDVYKTIAQDAIEGSAPSNQWPEKISADGVKLTVKESNLRGFTVPGKDWDKVSYEVVTFEEGPYIKKGTFAGQQDDDIHTCKVEAPTDFKGCFFKAPYIIDLSAMVQEGSLKNVDFKAEDKQSYATSASSTNVEINPPTGCYYVKITSSPQGVPIVKYYGEDGKTEVQ